MKKIVVTTAQKSAPANKGLVKNLARFIKEEKATDVYIFVAKGKSVYEEVSEGRLEDREMHPTQKNGTWKQFGEGRRRVYKVTRDVHPSIAKLQREGLAGATVHLLYDTKREGMQLNANLKLYHTQIAPQKSNPFYQVNKRLSDKYSYIVPGTKPFQDSIGGFNFKVRLFTSTGALTMPSYRTDFSVGNVANQEHTFGFVAVTIRSNRIFNADLVISTKQGDFQLDEKVYKGGKLGTGSVENYVCGDVHVDVSDKVAVKETKAHMQLLQPKIITFHDISDSKPINPHEDTNLFAKIARANPKNPDLEQSLHQVLAFIRDMCTSFPNSRIDIVESNHDEFLRRYIASQTYEQDYRNYLFVVGLIPKFFTDKFRKPALELAMEHISGGDLPSNLRFLNHTDLQLTRGFVTSRHGHKGTNGAKGSPASFIREAIKMIVGHGHRYIFRPNFVMVGHLTDLKKQKYAHSGISNWLQANAYIDSFGIVHGKILNSNFNRKK